MLFFKKRHEFRPDKTDSGLLNKLYITKKQRLNLLKWALITATLVMISVLQDVILSRVRIFGATTDLLCGALLLVSIMLDPEQSCFFLLAGSTAYHFSGSSPGPYVIALLTTLGLLICIFRQAYLRQGFAPTMVCTVVAIMVYELLLFGIAAFVGSAPLARLRIFALCGTYTVAVMPVLYPVFRAIGKIGGESWKE